MPIIAMSSLDTKENTTKWKPPNQEPSATERDRNLWRDLVAYWILGLCNNFGYVVMLSAAHDIIAQFESNIHHPVDSEISSTNRQCNIVSTGAILLADVVPLAVIKTVIPFLPFWVNIRIITSVALSVIGFLLVAYANEEWVAIMGVVSTSIATGIGESTLLAYTSRYNKNVISTWSSGTGGAGIIGALAYAALRSLHISSKNSMLIMLIVPGIECIAFWIILRLPRKSIDKAIASLDESEKPLCGFKQTVVFMASLCKYITPLLTVYFFEYFVNQGLFELVHFKNTFLDKEAQYRWLCVDYQIGVFISRSSVNLIHFRKIWIFSVIQCLVMLYFLTEVIYLYTPIIWISFGIVLVEGLLGGSAYVNTFYKIATDLKGPRQEFAMAITVQGDAIGIMLAGFMAIPVHNAICRLTAPERTTF